MWLRVSSSAAPTPGCRSTKPGANQRWAAPDEQVSDALGADGGGALEPASWGADRRTGAQQRRRFHPLRRVQHQLQTDAATDRITGVVEGLGAHVVGECQHRGREFGDREAARQDRLDRDRVGPTRRRGHARSAIAAAALHSVAAEVPSDRSEHEDRAHRRVRRSRLWPRSEWSWRRLDEAAGPTQRRIDQPIGGTGVVGTCWATGQLGHCTLFGEQPVRGGQVRGRARRVHPQPGEQFGGLGGRHDGVAGERAQCGPFGVPRAVGALVDTRPCGEVQGGAQAGPR